MALARQQLKSSSERIGQLYPILVDYYGNIIDGEHRFGANAKWRRARLKHIRSEKDRLIARIISNNVRRIVSPKEKRETLKKLGEIYLNEGINPGSIAHKIANETGMSYTWVVKYLPHKFKDRTQSERRIGSVTRHIPRFFNELLKPPKKEGTLRIKNFTNTNFVSLILEKGFYEEFAKKSIELGVPTEFSVLRALENHYEKMKKAVAIKNKESQAKIIELRTHRG